MTQIDRDRDPVVNVIGRATYDTQRAEGIVEARVYDDDWQSGSGESRPIPIAVEAERNQHDSLVLTVYAWLGCSVSQYFSSALDLQETFDAIVEEYDLERVEEFIDVEELEGSA